MTVNMSVAERGWMPLVLLLALVPLLRGVDRQPDDDGGDGMILYDEGQFADAVRAFSISLKNCERELGPEHAATLTNRSNLANALNAAGRPAKAEKEHRSVLAIRMRLLGEDAPDTIASRNNLAAALEAQGRDTEAEKEYRAVLAVREKTLAQHHFDVLKTSYALALCLELQDKYAEALIYARRAESGWLDTLGPRHPATARARMLRQRIEITR